MNTNEFLDLVISGEPAAARDKLNELLSARAFEALDARKVELAKTIFNGVQVEEEVKQIDEQVNVKKEYDDEEQSEHGVYKGKKKIGYVVHDKKTGTHTAYHGEKYGKDDYSDSDDFENHEHAVNQIKKSAGIN